MDQHPDRFDAIGTIADVDTHTDSVCRILKFGLTVGALIVSCYYGGFVKRMPQIGQRVHVVGTWERLEGCGTVRVDRLICLSLEEVLRQENEPARQPV
jgi:hypothetical protein